MPHMNIFKAALPRHSWPFVSLGLCLWVLHTFQVYLFFDTRFGHLSDAAILSESVIGAIIGGAVFAALLSFLIGVCQSYPVGTPILYFDNHRIGWSFFWSLVSIVAISFALVKFIGAFGSRDVLTGVASLFWIVLIPLLRAGIIGKLGLDALSGREQMEYEQMSESEKFDFWEKYRTEEV